MDLHHPSSVLCNDHADEDVTYDISQVGKSWRFNLHFPKNVPHAQNATGLKTASFELTGNPEVTRPERTLSWVVQSPVQQFYPCRRMVKLCDSIVVAARSGS